jgi:Carboxylesterase family
MGKYLNNLNLSFTLFGQCIGCMLLGVYRFLLHDRHINISDLDLEEFPDPLPVMFWLYGGGFVMGDATEENYLPGPLLDTKQVKINVKN